jgi:hypothetical protein
MRLLVLAATAALAVAPAFGALAGPASEDSCFLTRDLRGHTVGTDGHTLYFGVNGTNTYRVTTTGNCLAHATASDPIVLRDFGRGKICRPLDIELTVRGTRCYIGELTRLSPAEASALPKRLQP